MNSILYTENNDKKEALDKYIKQSNPRESIQVNLKLHLMY